MSGWQNQGKSTGGCAQRANFVVMVKWITILVMVIIITSLFAWLMWNLYTFELPETTQQKLMEDDVIAEYLKERHKVYNEPDNN
jgi:hypothetical protein